MPWGYGDDDVLQFLLRLYAPIVQKAVRPWPSLYRGQSLSASAHRLIDYAAGSGWEASRTATGSAKDLHAYVVHVTTTWGMQINGSGILPIAIEY